jgi:Ser/Thr protein kinase RdoA (MazF antagonist)
MIGPSSLTPRWMADWPVAHPRPVGDWTAVGTGAWARLDPESGGLHRVDPARDPELPALGHTMRRGTLVGYRAGRRAVVATEQGFVKVVRRRRVARLVEIHEAIATASGAPAVPLVEAATSDGAIDLSPVRGRSLHELIRRGAHASVLADAARALAALHHTTPPAMLEPGAPDTARRWVGVVARAEPAAADALVPLAACIDADLAGLASRRSDARTVLVHGDCHDKNLFVDPAGSGFIDLDGARLGMPEEDVANLAVHVALRSLQAGAPADAALARRDVVIDAYRRSAPLDDAGLAVLERAVWFRLACLYRFRSAGRPMVSALLELARPYRDSTMFSPASSARSNSSSTSTTG